ncbi:bifunctional phosphopantothenoylcysteine decarboxylase/phosphopantothenate--cysteine ligase CoaBC [Jiulongibacter sediminis]|uniref:Coenzyme A biosynthesis bifunctional protein CoaBC n=1 Tax=Jiulongibacter sediminis TaxID=1605367 RepID=A0A0P7C6W6_9BACT|nr:bifunctional phosphopantothenoylcysteine decarboxylase/phosphopantothenate--cysteine ligase CoaBC [Jiulongibacter sediminis]KPM49177.1 phosphopantothenoylcysteine decarboxylase [Jiulongibacter sediminis]TBX26231.1 phosphopantothenoylcysteine decarboxylase [Jiulongibacter sediminis]
MLSNKKILLGVSGSISAYKAAFLVRLLVKEGAEVKVIMTEAAKDFISPLTLATLSKNPVLSDFTKGSNGEWNNHVDLGLWADLILIAPASANTLAKCAHGICDNLLVATYLSAKCPVVFAPAMDLDMYQHGSTRENLSKLKSYGNQIIEAESGELASGLVGQGRLAEPEHIIDLFPTFFIGSSRFKDKRVLITSGPTQEAIDPVRFISNHSSGKMGYAIAKAFRNAGANVQVVSGPVNIEKPQGVEVFKVKSAQEMFAQTKELFGAAEIIVYVAAVADYTPEKVSDKKLKKSDDDLAISLKRTPDIAGTLGKLKNRDQIAVGFALETDNARENALRKLEKKNLDMIVLNSLQDSGAGFRYDTNKITVVHRNGEVIEHSLKTKDEVAVDILAEIEKILKK